MKLIIVIIVLILGYFAYYHVSERRGFNEVLEVCVDNARTFEEGERCREQYRENIQ